MVKVFRRPQCEESLLGSTEKQNLLVVVKKVYDICESSLADPVPEHESATGIFRHSPIFDSVVVAISLDRWVGGMRAGRPIAHIVATNFHAIDNYVFVSAFGKVALHSLISAVCIAD